MSKVLYFTPGKAPRRTYEAVKACVASLIEAGLPGEIKVTTPDIQEMENEVNNLRKFIAAKGLQFEYASQFGSGKITAVWIDEATEKEYQK